jgi:hypothetical protein
MLELVRWTLDSQTSFSPNVRMDFLNFKSEVLLLWEGSKLLIKGFLLFNIIHLHNSYFYLQPKCTTLPCIRGAKIGIFRDEDVAIFRTGGR